MTSFNSFDHLSSNITSFIGLSFNSESIDHEDLNSTSTAKDQQENIPGNLVDDMNNIRIHDSSALSLRTLNKFQDDYTKQPQKTNEINLKVISGNNFSSVTPKPAKRLYVPGSFENESENNDKTSILNEIKGEASSLFMRHVDLTESSKTLTLGDLNNTSISTNNLRNINILNDDINVSSLSHDFHNLLEKPDMSFSTIILENENMENNTSNCNNNNKKKKNHKVIKKRENKRLKKGKKKTLSTLSALGENTIISGNSIVTELEEPKEPKSTKILNNLDHSMLLNKPQQIVTQQDAQEDFEVKTANTSCSAAAKIVPHGIELVDDYNTLDLSSINEPMTSKCGPFLGEYDLDADEKIMIDISNYEIQKSSVPKTDYSMTQRIMNYFFKLFKPNDFRSKNLWDQFLRKEESDFDYSEIATKDVSE